MVERNVANVKVVGSKPTGRLGRSLPGQRVAPESIGKVMWYGGKAPILGSHDPGLGGERTSGEIVGQPRKVAADRKLVEAKPEPIGEDSGGRERVVSPWNSVALTRSEGRRVNLMTRQS